MQENEFWLDAENASKITKEEKLLKDKLEKFNLLKSKYDDCMTYIELLEEEDEEDTLEELNKEIKDLEEEIERYKILILLSGKYDKDNAIVTLHAGAGGTDAQDWTSMLLRLYVRWAEKKGYEVETIDYIPGDEAGIKSTTFKISGEYAYGYLRSEKGIHRLVRISPFNANNKRQTSFASLEILPELTEEQDIPIRSEDIKLDTFRASGAGGQYVNKTDSAVRLTHIPTGLIVKCSNERSQHSNRETAMKMLKAKLAEKKEREQKEKIEDLAGDIMDNGFGSQIRSYVFHPYNMVKDHRTMVETANVDKVMDGDIDIFINEYLKKNKE